MNNVILIGMPASGKSTVGVLLAKAMGYDFLDSDLLIQRREGRLLQDLVDDLGVEGFLTVESSAIASIHCENTVIAPGGSAVCRPEMVQHLRSLGKVIYIDVPLAEIQARMDNITTRGIAMGQGETLSDVLAKRAPLYQSACDLAIPCLPGDSPEILVMKIVQVLGSQ